MGQLDSSIDDFDQAIRLAPDLGFAYNNRAVSYIRLGRYDQAQADVDRAQKLGVHPAEAIEELGNRR
jgi:tetratricopeptide (TPR) repeat protein